MKVIVTCPPMLGMREQFIPIFEERGITVFCPNVTQVMTEEELIDIVPQFDGWIIGDDPATRKVFEAGKAGKLKAAVKWGIGIDNVDFDACKDLNIPITNTPGMFGDEVSDMAIGYMLALARETFYIDREIRNGGWPKNRGISLRGKTVGVIGYGDIGKNTVLKSQAFGMNTLVFDPVISSVDSKSKLETWPNRINECDFLVFACALNKQNYHMLNKDILLKCKMGVRIINVARGQLINELDLITHLKTGRVHSAALDVFEIEPLPQDSFLRQHNFCILGSHNSSNTSEAVIKTNNLAISKILEFLDLNY